MGSDTALGDTMALEFRQEHRALRLEGSASRLGTIEIQRLKQGWNT